VILHKFDPASIRAAWWARRALRVVHDDLRDNGLEFAPPPAPPRLPTRARRGVLAVFRRQESTCLERALVLQRWHSAHGDDRDVIIAVKGPSVDFAAHAWLDGEPDPNAGSFAELMRLAPR
jgi:transglutaminase superfamily protein